MNDHPTDLRGSQHTRSVSMSGQPPGETALSGDTAALVSGSALERMPTPSLLLDRSRLERNCERARARCRELGVRLRPHMKTAKSISAARLAMDPALKGIAVSTLLEAEYFADEGIDDIQLAVCVTPDKLERAAAVNRRVRRFGAFVDSLDTARAMAARRGLGSPPMGAWIEIDSGEHRTGVALDAPEFLEIACVLHAAPSIRLEGVATHAGQSYDAASPAELVAIADLERRTIVEAGARLEAVGLAGLQTSVGSTPTLFHAQSGEGLTEFRAGVYMLGDLFQVGAGSLSLEDVAVSVLASVISRRPGGRRVILDTGGLALSKDRSTAGGYQKDYGYGRVADLRGRPYGEVVIHEVAQEHGFVDWPAELPLPAIGERVRIFPNHVCMTTAMYPKFEVLEGERVVDEWVRVSGW
ncbi:alanine racemase [Caulobacter sp. S45]|uniref:alanine racemase n=1 Tax=Caulobacter sp. S45 TaxID=1641861 RepID=UPI001C2D5197|nr:alanine racemase [Caulobacter sp. S45]